MSRLDHLAVYLSDRCNLSCSYCYVSVNEGPAARLSFDQVRKAIDEFCAHVPPPDRKVTFLGGEPLLDWGLFVRCARYAREKGGDGMVLQTFTNGTSLTPERIAFFNDVGVHCTVSLDGKKEDNDAHRVYHADHGRSVYDDVMARLRPLPKENLGVSLVFTAKTVERLLANVHDFYQMGFSRITFNPELYEAWPDDRLRVMRAALSGLARWYRALLDSGARVPQIQILFAVMESLRANERGEHWWKECHNMVLGPDGRYYSCDKALAFPSGSAPALQAGDAVSGLDWSARERQIADYEGWISEKGPSEDVFCPIGVVAHARISGRDEAEALRQFRRAESAFAQGLMDLIRQCSGHPAFKEIYEQVRFV